MRAGDTSRLGRRKPAALPGRGVAVDEEQRRRLVECCAFFRAQQFRNAALGQIRSADLAAAEADIDSALARARCRRRR